VRNWKIVILLLYIVVDQTTDTELTVVSLMTYSGREMIQQAVVEDYRFIFHSFCFYSCISHVILLRSIILYITLVLQITLPA